MHIDYAAGFPGTAVVPITRICALGLVSIAVLTSCTDAPASDASDLESMSQEAPMHFERSIRLEEEGATSANVSLGDVNGDGHLDVVLAKGRHWPLTDPVLLGDGTGSFSEPTLLSETPDRSYSSELVDLDGDGDLDVVVSNDTPDPKQIYLNDGAGNFTPGTTFGEPEWSTRHVAVADMNGDGLPDLILANRTGDSSGLSYVCVNRGEGRFDAECDGFASESATTITPVDVNRDGALDLVVPHREGGQSHTYLNDGAGGFDERVPFGPEDAAVRMAKSGDLNGDGHPDLVLIEPRRGTSILFGEGMGVFDQGPVLSGVEPPPYSLRIADLDGDGSEDIIVGHVEAPSTVYFNDGSGTSFTPVHFGDGEGAAYGFAVGDVDEDGILDIAVARSDAPNMLFFGGMGASGGGG